MTRIFVPRHLTEPLPRDSFPPPTGKDVVTVDVDMPEDGDEWQRLIALYEEVADTVASHTGSADAATVISGDCLMAVASLTGVQRAGLDPSIVWVALHGYLNRSKSLTSGYTGGMPLRLIMGEHPELLADPLGMHTVSQSRSVLIEARNLDPDEADFLRGSDVRRYGIADIDGDSLPDGPLVMHIDGEVVETRELERRRVNASAGPEDGAVLSGLRRILDTGRVVAIDIASPWHAAQDQPEQQMRGDLLAQVLALSKG